MTTKTLADLELVELSPATQKAIGVKALLSHGKLGGFALLIRNEEDARLAAAFWDKLVPPEGSGHKLIVRACPTTPNHGGFETVIAGKWTDIIEYYRGARDVDPGSEVLLMPFVDAAYNVIATPEGFSFGEGHAGATAGVNAFAVPRDVGDGGPAGWQSLREVAVESRILDEAGAVAYFELIAPNMPRTLRSRFPSMEGVSFVQCRRGPSGPTFVGDWIPADTVVTDVLCHTGDDLEWEAITKKHDGSDGAVAYLPGVTSKSHAAIHCKLRHIPYVQGAKPAIGARLVKNVDAAVVDKAEYARGIMDGLSLDVFALGRDAPPFFKRKVGDMMATLATYAVHNTDSLLRYAPWIHGVAVAFMLRAGTAAIFGETRHAPRKSRALLPASLLSGVAFSGFEKSIFSLDRATIFANAFAVPYWVLRRQLQLFTAVHDFAEWPSGSYGGKKWGECCYATLELDDAVCDLLGGVGTVESVAAALNSAVNKAHNGGWWMNKFVGNNLMDLLASGDFNSELTAASVAWRAHQIRGTARGKVRLRRTRWQAHLKRRYLRRYAPCPLGPTNLAKPNPLAPFKPYAGGKFVAQAKLVPDYCTNEALFFHIQFGSNSGKTASYYTKDVNIPACLTDEQLRQVINWCAEVSESSSLAGTDTKYMHLKSMVGTPDMTGSSPLPGEKIGSLSAVVSCNIPVPGGADIVLSAPFQAPWFYGNKAYGDGVLLLLAPTPTGPLEFKFSLAKEAGSAPPVTCGNPECASCSGALEEAGKLLQMAQAAGALPTTSSENDEDSDESDEDSSDDESDGTIEGCTCDSCVKFAELNKAAEEEAAGEPDPDQL